MRTKNDQTRWAPIALLLAILVAAIVAEAAGAPLLAQDKSTVGIAPLSPASPGAPAHSVSADRNAVGGSALAAGGSGGAAAPSSTQR